MTASSYASKTKLIVLIIFIYYNTLIDEAFTCLCIDCFRLGEWMCYMENELEKGL